MNKFRYKTPLWTLVIGLFGTLIFGTTIILIWDTLELKSLITLMILVMYTLYLALKGILSRVKKRYVEIDLDNDRILIPNLLFLNQDKVFHFSEIRKVSAYHAKGYAILNFYSKPRVFFDLISDAKIDQMNLSGNDFSEIRLLVAKHVRMI
ncbi:MAG: hypothetical protein MRY83_09415 [Flavobacteriales bacterium]|nr:hypothetical protein [Flavobacteriales bacterium]